jgi:hypothetical protein
VHQIAAALLGLQRSMLVLSEEDAQAHERRTKLQQLKARLKSLLRPQLATAVEHRNLGMCWKT